MTFLHIIVGIAALVVGGLILAARDDLDARNRVAAEEGRPAGLSKTAWLVVGIVLLAVGLIQLLLAIFAGEV